MAPDGTDFQQSVPFAQSEITGAAVTCREI